MSNPQAPGEAPRPSPSTAPHSPRLESLLADLKRPLDEGDWRVPVSTERAAAPKPGLARRLRHQREHRRELKRARRAAAASLGVKPERKARRRAARMLVASAAGMTAITIPTASVATTDLTAGTVATGPQRQSAHQLSASDHLKRALAHSEGVSNVVYRDVAGFPTVGVGHLVTPRDGLQVGDRISDRQVQEFLVQDLRKAESDVRALVGATPLFQHEFDALVDLVYNVGIGTLSPSKSPRLTSAIAAADYREMAAQLNYRYAGGSYVDGLNNRSARRMAMFTGGEYDGVTIAPARAAV